MKITTERITPDLATSYLNRNTNNRHLREGVAEKYASDMKAGLWTESPDPVIFYEDGSLGNGQHRLWAVIDSDTTQTFMVIRDFPRSAALNIDTGATRSLVDNAHISGKDEHLSNALISVARAIEEGNRAQQSLSNATRLAIVKKHREAAEWAIKHGPTGRWLRNSIILAAIGRALYHEKDRDRLLRFCEVLRTGFADNKTESAGVALRNYLVMKGSNDISLVTASMWKDTFFKVQNAIWYFMHDKTLTMIKRVNEEAYPLPGVSRKRLQAGADGKKIGRKKRARRVNRVSKEREAVAA